MHTKNTLISEIKHAPFLEEERRVALLDLTERLCTAIEGFGLADDAAAQDLLSLIPFFDELQIEACEEMLRNTDQPFTGVELKRLVAANDTLLTEGEQLLSDADDADRADELEDYFAAA